MNLFQLYKKFVKINVTYRYLHLDASVIIQKLFQGEARSDC